MTKCVNRTGIRTVPRAIAMAALMTTLPVTHAVELSGPDDDVSVTWNNTIRYGMAFRVKGQSPALTANPNADDGDRNFDKGLISNRVELLTEFDVKSNRGFGARVSAQGWYDSVYNSSNDNPGFAGGAVPNNTSVAPNEFNPTTRRLHGRDLQLRDAFAFFNSDVDGRPVTLRLGQHALVWGESLFFAGNGIAGAQNRFDIARLQADPTAQAKEFVLPVPQLSGQVQVTPEVTIGAYYQPRWEPNRFPAVGSYFSVGDLFGPGAENMWTGPFSSAPRLADMKAKNSGQGGVQLRWRADETDYGVYLMQFHDKTPQIVTQVGPRGPTGFYHAYHENTKLLGASASRTFGDANVALEASVRRNQALASSGGTVDVTPLLRALPFPVPIPTVDNADNPAYAVGNTAHVNLSTIWSLPPNGLFRESTLVGEIAWNRMLSCKKHCVPGAPGVPAALDPNGKRDAIGMRMVFTPTYRQVLPGMDLSIPVGLSYAPKGSRSLALGPGVLPPNNGGDFTLGMSVVYDATWYFDAAYTHFYGKADTLLSSDPTRATAPPFTYGQSLRDRNFLTLTLRRTF
ncbi:DUF1302 domain-containing protein [Noviherbaspirillum saxi]|uniref:DUF1302 family protein n=1 Tax=Noviherbaspirillum saxi TaxID=2320863 RepID=A0A3A3FMS9_9BURK|nr:DUF1302 domain-containing protein [Noviherbaspirillum saxi]RJF95785.1 DUF1302 family protein [Noviherbaspirillum saxi]